MHRKKIQKILESHPIRASAPCRIDMGGTLDISTFHYPLRHLNPCTVNIAVDLRTEVSLHPFTAGKIKVTSKGFKSAEFKADAAPFNHPLGLIFAVAAYFRIHGVHIMIDSASPPRSALGGSSSAAVALIRGIATLLPELGDFFFSKPRTALLAHAIESSVAGVPCGLQDQLAAVYGGVNAWYWRSDPGSGVPYQKVSLVSKRHHRDLERHLLLAYCGIPHESKSVNSVWIRQFLSAKYRTLWEQVVGLTHDFEKAVMKQEYQKAAQIIAVETALRRKMTPFVLDEIGRRLVSSAERESCGARFTGAGGGGCIWSIGEAEAVKRLKPQWEHILSRRRGARLLEVKIDSAGVLSGG
ncbi:MAG: galactokinase [Thermodesulfobacteriota bacterium]